MPPERLQESVEKIHSALATQRESGPSKPKWQMRSAKWKEFQNHFLALLHLYVEDLKKFKKTLEPGGDEAKKLGFAKSPFISTTKHAEHAVKYAKGEKATKKDVKRTEGVVGRVFIYIFKIVDLAKQAAVDPVKLANAEKIGMDPRKRFEGEITFTGAAPGENLEDQMDINATWPVDKYAFEIRTRARAKGKAHGGLLPWGE